MNEMETEILLYGCCYPSVEEAMSPEAIKKRAPKLAKLIYYADKGRKNDVEILIRTFKSFLEQGVPADPILRDHILKIFNSKNDQLIPLFSPAKGRPPNDRKVHDLLLSQLNVKLRLRQKEVGRLRTFRDHMPQNIEETEINHKDLIEILQSWQSYDGQGIEISDCYCSSPSDEDAYEDMCSYCQDVFDGKREREYFINSIPEELRLPKTMSIEDLAEYLKGSLKQYRKEQKEIQQFVKDYI